MRHIPSDEYGESLKKALSYEALRGFSANAATSLLGRRSAENHPRHPRPYGAALQAALQEAAIAPEAFAKALQAAAPLVGADIVAAQSRITSTRPGFSTVSVSPPAISRRKNCPQLWSWPAKSGLETMDSRERVIGIIMRGLLNESLL